MRRVLLVNALIFAVLAAAVALAYYGYPLHHRGSRERELQLMHDLAEEKVLNIESLIVRDDARCSTSLELDKVGDAYVRSRPRPEARGARERVRARRPAPARARRLVVAAATSKEALAIRDWFLANVMPEAAARDAAGRRARPRVRRGATASPYLFSFMRRVSGDRTFYVVHRGQHQSPRVRAVPAVLQRLDNKRLYQVVDERGELVLRLRLRARPGGRSMSRCRSSTRSTAGSCASRSAISARRPSNAQAACDRLGADRRRGHRDPRRPRVPRDRDPPRAPVERAQERVHLERVARAEDAAVDHLDVRRDARERPHEERRSRRPSTPRSSGARACGSAG